MKPLDVYRLGVRLARVGSTEAEQRAAVGRLYYGLHHEACCRYFRVNPNAQPLLGRRSRHVQLISRYDALNTVTARRIRSGLKQLSRMRNISDYELASPIQYQNRHWSATQLVSRAITVAESVLDELEAFSPGEAKDGCYCPVV